MKKITIMISAALFSAMAFISCSKNDNLTVKPGTTKTDDKGSSSSGTDDKNGSGTDDKNGSGTDDESTTTSTGGTGTTSSKSPKLRYQLKASNYSYGVAPKPTAAGSFTWTKATASPSVIKFEAKRNGVELEYKTVNTTTIDLMSPTATYFGGFAIAAGTYNEVELKIELSRSSAPSVQLTGTYSDGSTTIPVSVVINEMVSLKTEQHNVTMSDSSTFTSLTVFDLSRLTSGITSSVISSATLTSGTLVISSTSNVVMYNKLIANFKNEDHHHEIGHD
jgi:hypothetical protein